MRVRLEYFFSHPYHFPWDFMGLSCPMAAETHLYLCSFLADYDMNQANYLKGSPSWTELQRFANENGGLAKIIADSCQHLYNKKSYEREPVAREVMEFLRRFNPFMQDMQNKIDEAYRKGYISVPRECRPLT